MQSEGSTRWKMKKIRDIHELIDSIQLEEMDWQKAKEAAKQSIREAKLMLELNNIILYKAEAKLRDIWLDLPDEARMKRYQDD